MKAKKSPKNQLVKAIEIYIGEKLSINEVLTAEDYFDVKLRAIGFALREILLSHGYSDVKYELDLDEKCLYIFHEGILFYVVENEELQDIDNVDSLSFNLFCHWGAITSCLQQMGYDPYITETTQTSFWNVV